MRKEKDLKEESLINTFMGALLYRPQQTCYICETNKATGDFLGVPLCHKCLDNLEKKEEA